VTVQIASNTLSGFHNARDTATAASLKAWQETTFDYDFEDFFHPFIAELINKLNQTSVAGMLDPDFLASLVLPFVPPPAGSAAEYKTLDSTSLSVTIEPRVIDVSIAGPYANHNWELLYHIPVMVAVHLSNNQRFAEAQEWFHLIFDPTSTDTKDMASEQRFWRSFVFNGDPVPPPNINSLLALLSEGGAAAAEVITGYNAILANPFQPHVVARTRPSAYQWYVIMKYMDNMLAWGDSGLLADTQETINEARLCYVLLGNMLGSRAQQMPAPGTTATMNFLQLKQAGLDQMSNAMVELEAQFPFNLAPAPTTTSTTDDQSGALFGIGRSLFFCIPPNPNLLAYWDTVADRLFKIRNSENIEGVVQQLPLFDPPLDPGMLVKATAAGLDIGSIVSGLNQPLGPVRSLPLIQKSLELASEVRSFGAALLAALEKNNAEQLALLRQSDEVRIQQLMQDVRFLEWRHAQEATNGLLKTRTTAVERYSFYLRLLNLTPDPGTVPTALAADRRELTEENFEDAYSTLVSAYDLDVATLKYSSIQWPAGTSSPSTSAGASGQGQLYLNQNEDVELNTHLPKARNLRLTANVANAIASGVTPVPSAEAHLAFWGMGIHSKLFSGETLAGVAKLVGEIANMSAAWEQDQGGIAARTAGYQRRVDDWTLQANLAANELMQIGSQLLASLIAEQIAYHNYTTVKTQLQQAQDIHSFLESKFTSAVFYTWMQSELSGLYYQYYRLATDTARQAEQTVKQELMRPELDSTQFIQFNYWDSGQQGLLAGEALHLDIKRLEMAYLSKNTRGLEMTTHVSLRQLDPMALLALKVTGACTVSVPEWFYDREGAGHYMRRIKNLSVTVPCVVGPYTSINCTVTLQSSSVRTSSLLANGAYARAGQEDDRFVDYFGSTDVIVTSAATNDSGMFETNLRDERFLPFEGAGAISTWNLSLPIELAAFDYSTITDVILHIRYTAREAGDPLGAQATKELQAMFDNAAQSSQALLFCLRFDFPTEWAVFVNGTADFTTTLTKALFPYAVQGAKKLTIDALTLYAANGESIASSTPTVDLAALSSELSGVSGAAAVSFPSDDILTREQTQEVFLLLQYHFGRA
jgi:Tc toxin complex TcA C-terminal TcB-binding domain